MTDNRAKSPTMKTPQIAPKDVADFTYHEVQQLRDLANMLEAMYDANYQPNHHTRITIRSVMHDLDSGFRVERMRDDDEESE